MKDAGLEALQHKLDLLAQMHIDNERARAEREAWVDQKFAMLTERTAQLMETMNRLGRIIEMHEHRLDSHDGRLDDLEGGGQ